MKKVTIAVLLIIGLGLGLVLLDWYQHQSEPGNEYAWLDVSPDGSEIVFSAEGDGNKDLYAMNLKSMRVVRLFKTPDYENNPAFSPDGKEIIFQRGSSFLSQTHLVVLDLNTGHERQINSPPGFSDASPRFTNDGKKVVFESGPTWYDFDIYSINADGTGRRRLTNLDMNSTMQPCADSIGSRIWFAYPVPPIDSSDSEGRVIIEYVDTSGKIGPDCIDIGRQNEDPYLFRSGKRIAFESDVLNDGTYDVCISATSGKPHPTCLNTSRLVNFPESLSAPADGKCIYFIAGEPAEIWRINSDGSGERRIAGDEIFTDPMNWRPGN